MGECIEEGRGGGEEGCTELGVRKPINVCMCENALCHVFMLLIKHRVLWGRNRVCERWKKERKKERKEELGTERWRDS